MPKSKNNVSTPASKTATEPPTTDTLVQIDDGRGSDIKTELQSKFGVKLKKGTTPGSPTTGVRKSGHVPSKALQPRSAVKPSVLLSQARGPIGSQFSAAKTQQVHEDKNTPFHDDNALDSDHIYTNVSDEENDLGDVFSENVTRDSTGVKRPPYVNLDDESEEPETVLHRARAVYDFRQAEEGEISIITRQKVEVLKDDISGWSFVRNTDGVQGWCPANYLVKIEDSEDSDGDHDYQNEDFPVGPPINEGIIGKGLTAMDSEAAKPKFDISDITKVKLKPTTSQTSSGDSSTGVGKPVLPVKPTKALKPPVASKKPAIATAKPQSPKTKQKPSVSAKPKVNGIKNTQATSVQKLAKSFNQK